MMRMAKPFRESPDGRTFYWRDGSVTTWDEEDGVSISREGFPSNWKKEVFILDKVMDYCAIDVMVERQIDKLLPALTDSELEVWRFDQKVNERGIPFDTKFVKVAAAATKLENIENGKSLFSISEGKVKTVGSTEALRAWLAGRGYSAPDIRLGALKRIKEEAKAVGDISAIKAIEIREQGSKTSTAKYKTILGSLTEDGRARFVLGYHGTSTGRWSGQVVQPQNLPRFDSENKLDNSVIKDLNAIFTSGEPPKAAYHRAKALYGGLLPWLSKGLRSSIKAANGSVLVGGDYSNIEGRINAWLAGETWKVEAFAKFDSGEGPDLYKMSYANSFNVEPDSVSKDQRQIGKVQELASGFQGGVGAYLLMVKGEYKELVRKVFENTDSELWGKTYQAYLKAEDKTGLDQHHWTGLKILVKAWRDAHPNIVQSWWDYQDAALAAVGNPGTIYDVADISPGRGNFIRGAVQYMSDGNYLYCKLPSGRCQSYAKPSVVRVKATKVNKKGETYETFNNELHAWGVDSKTRKWVERNLYGGLLCENVVSSTGRDIMVQGMTAVEKAGYPVILTVHDEVLSEVNIASLEERGLSEKHYERLLSINPSWAAGLPLAAKAWSDERYIK
jgi:DNA polymerase